MFLERFIDASHLELGLYQPKPGLGASQHHDRCVRYTHELSDDAAEAWTRSLVRLVPVVYAGGLGAFSEHPLLWVLPGVLFSVALDLKMGERSLLRPLLGPLVKRLCPRVAALSRRLVRFGRRIGIPIPHGILQLSCDQGRP